MAYDCSPQPLNQPQPPSESCISCSRLTPALTIFVSSASSNTGLRVVAFPAFGALGGVADFLGVEVGALLLDRFEVELHSQQRLLRDDGGQEAVERLLGAAVGIIDEVGQGVDHRAGQRRRVADFEPRLLGAPLLAAR